MRAISNDWKLFETQPKKIAREFSFTDFKQALDFVNKVGAVAEKLNHHPDIVLKWAYVKVEFWTHNAKGLTKMDFAAASEIDKISY